MSGRWLTKLEKPIWFIRPFVSLYPNSFRLFLHNWTFEKFKITSVKSSILALLKIFILKIAEVLKCLWVNPLFPNIFFIQFCLYLNWRGEATFTPNSFILSSPVSTCWGLMNTSPTTVYIKQYRKTKSHEIITQSKGGHKMVSCNKKKE